MRNNPKNEDFTKMNTVKTASFLIFNKRGYAPFIKKTLKIKKFISIMRLLAVKNDFPLDLFVKNVRSFHRFGGNND